MFEYRYKTDLKTRYLTAIHFFVFIAIAATLLILIDGGYYLAWFISIVIAVIALMVLSIPRYITLDEDGLDICCVSDYTHIPYGEIAAIRRVDSQEMKFMLPVFAASGFFGYYGNFLDIKAMDFVTIYATKWDNFVEITDIYEDKYYISCDQSEELIENVMKCVSLKPENNE